MQAKELIDTLSLLSFRLYVKTNKEPEIEVVGSGAVSSVFIDNGKIYIKGEGISKTEDRLSKIESIAREAFSDPDTQDINLYRAQALARIFQIFEYDL